MLLGLKGAKLLPTVWVENWAVLLIGLTAPFVEYGW